MNRDLGHYAVCPACYGEMELHVTSDQGSDIEEGEFKCLACGIVYPVHNGIALLSAIDVTWLPLIKEIAARADVEARASTAGFESDRLERAYEFHNMTHELMSQLLEEAFEGVEVTTGMRVLDVGAGNGQIAANLAEKGAFVVGCAADVSGLYQENAGPSEPAIVRVMADARRLPFRDASFDMTFCRSTIHHIDSPGTAIKEMCRVTRQEGRVLLISEPVRSLFDREIDYLQGIFDYEEGLNEQFFAITRYTLPMRRYCKGVEVLYHLAGCKERAEKVLQLARIDHAAHFHDGERLGFAGSFKLLISGASVNVTGTRSQRGVGRPGVVPPGAVIASPIDLLSKNSDNLLPIKALYRSLADRRNALTAIDLYEADCSPPARGWRDPQTTGDITFRYSGKSAMMYLKNDPGCDGIALSLLDFPPEASAATGRVIVNDVECGRFELTQFDCTLSFHKPPGAKRVLEVTVVNDSTFIPDKLLGNGDLRELGIGVVRMWQQ